jgi:hypothetical protein
MTQDDRLLHDIARRNWIILGLLVLLSLFWWSIEITMGVAAGGLLAIFGHHWRERALRKMLAMPSDGAAKGFQVGYIVRLAFYGSAIYLLIVKAQVAPLALAAGLSIVILNIYWLTFKRLL